jgi:hypothetical protein
LSVTPKLVVSGGTTSADGTVWGVVEVPRTGEPPVLVDT